MAKYFFGHATTLFMGLEWGQNFVITTRTEQSAQKKAEKQDWTHGDGIEEFDHCSIREIPEEHYLILKEYVLDANDLPIP